MSAWESRRLDQLVRFRNGKSIKPGGGGKYPVYGSNGVIGSSDEAMYEAAVILGRVGAYCGSVELCRGKFWASDNTIVVEVIPEVTDLRFLCYVLRDANLNRYAGGAAQPLLTQSRLKPLEFPVPPLSIQRRIASVLSAYDDLIENNTRRIAILEEMARRLYEEWFVQFRFPGYEKVSFKESELGSVPEGWRLAALGDLVDEVRGMVHPSNVAPDTPYVGLEHIPRRSITLREWSSANTVESNKLPFRRGDILFGKIRPYFHKVCFAPLDGICSSDTILLRPKENRFFGVALCCASSDQFVSHATQTSRREARAAGTGLGGLDEAVDGLDAAVVQPGLKGVEDAGPVGLEGQRQAFERLKPATPRPAVPALELGLGDLARRGLGVELAQGVLQPPSAGGLHLRTGERSGRYEAASASSASRP